MDTFNRLTGNRACYSHPCLNGATCVEELDGYSCSCLGGYIGIHCEQLACYSHPCLNGATCVEELDGYSCSCLGGYIGIHCEQLVCPVGWVYGHTKCFLIVNSLPDAAWTTARDYCNGLDAVTMGNGEMVEPSLLFIENVEEYDLLKPHLNGPRSWLNCKYVNTWKCYTDRAGTKSDYRNHWAMQKEHVEFW
eukprot:XP_011677402.1 PREDICTED: sushi, von Willebrand factor type A, EGF and pentraxin domain-containing protein 1-like [Strongylocentrotus purpuratus]